MHHCAYQILGFDFVNGAQPPITKDLVDRAHKREQHIHLMDRLADQRTAALAGPASLHRPSIIFICPVPLHIGVGLQNLSQPSRGQRAFEKQRRIVKAMLAHHAQLNGRRARQCDHGRSRLQVYSHRLLHQHVFAILRAQLHRGQPVAGKGAEIEKIHVRALAQLLRIGYILGTPRLSKLPPFFFGAIGARRDLVADVFVGLCMFPCNRAGSDNSHSHGLQDSHHNAVLRNPIIQNGSGRTALAKTVRHKNSRHRLSPDASWSINFKRSAQSDSQSRC